MANRNKGEKSMTWEAFFKEKLEPYNDAWAEDTELLEALNEIMEERF